ncbi:hypothetical protein QJS10_CPB13g01198 [Acorus calamus]|uniref:Retrotransposon gag domain-containing protein n=1 Tax=Acorus calamus TaxID=4465 RepID=A0AAV9DGM8_ACOCL|nr:hypothetical protein QJS10_CPB13g01198 [Acorus calamus]
MQKLTELFDRHNSQTNSPPANLVHDEEENSRDPPQNHGGRSGNTMGTRQNGSQHSYAPKFIKLDFPHFNGGEDTINWVCRVNQFFQFHQTPEEERVALASFHLEGDAQLWYQLLRQERGLLTWQEFCNGVHTQYGPTQFQDFFRELTRLQQDGSIRDYQTQFEKLLSKVGHLPQNSQVNCFISGLKDTIKADGLSGRPTSLSSTIGLARLYEARNAAQRQITSTQDSKNFLTNKEMTTNNSSIPV